MAAEILEESSNLESTTVYLWRNAKVVKGGRRFSLSALVVVGDRRGSVGIGYGKAAGAPAAIEKAQKNARKKLYKVTLLEGTIPHEVTGRSCASSVRLIPAAPGTGVIAGATVRAVLEMAGIRDCLTKAYGSTNQKNLVKACVAGLLSLRSKQQVAELRGVDLDASTVEAKLEAGRRYAPQSRPGVEKARGPVSKFSAQRGGGRGRGGGGRGRRGRDGEGEQQQQQQAAPAVPAPEAPAAGGDAQA
jgi:small subunit ribosomal protein S5